MSGSISSTSTSACYLHFKGDVSESSYTNYMASDPPNVKPATVISNKFYYMTIRCNLADVTFNNYRVRPMIVMEDETDYAYEPYNTTIYSVTFPSSAGTVYGGELTVNKDGACELLVDRVSAKISSTAWTRIESGDVVAYRCSATGKKTGYATVISSIYKTGNTSDSGEGTITGRSTNLYIFIVDSRFSSTNDWLAAVGEETFVYELATPVSYSLTIPQVRSLLGINNILADTGKINEADYSADIKMYVNAVQEQIDGTQKIIAEPENAVATANHEIGDLFICNDQLYRAIDSIAVGETLVIGENIVSTTIADEIAEIKNLLSNILSGN